MGTIEKEWIQKHKRKEEEYNKIEEKEKVKEQKESNKKICGIRRMGTWTQGIKTISNKEEFNTFIKGGKKL